MAAATLLHSVMAAGADLESALSQNEAYVRLEGPDRGLARAIASSALRGLGRIDSGLQQLVDRPLGQIEPPVLAVLRAGAAQLWMQETPGYAAVSATVEAARRWRPASRGGKLVNAVLRRASERPEIFSDLPAESIWPEWLAARFLAALGPDRCEALARLQLEEPPIDLTLKPETDPSEFAEQIEGIALPNRSVRISAGRYLPDLPGYAAGEWWVQDAGATLAADLISRAQPASVLDLCAAPGGKTMQLAARGANVTAVDVSAQRLKILTANLSRTGLEVNTIEADARTWRPDEPADAVLLDAPCSAMGILRRHPEAAWRRDPGSLARYPERQAALVRAAADMLRPGGELVYCVCTPFAEEGEGIVEAAIAGGGWTRKPVHPSEVPGFEHALTTLGDVLTAPAQRCADDAELLQNAAEAIDSDIFFVSRLERR